VVKFYKTAIGRGIKPIVGADVWTAAARDADDAHRMTLLCMDERGSKNLSRLLTAGYAEAQYHGRALLLDEWLTRESLAGPIALPGAGLGELGKALAADSAERVARVLDAWRARMPDRFYIECQRLGRPGEADYLERAVELAAREGLPLAA